MTVVEYEGSIVDRRRRPALPGARPARHRPRAARLRLPARPRRRHRGDLHHARPRGPHRRAAVRAARTRHRAADLRRAADDGDGALEARRAQAQGQSVEYMRPGDVRRAGPFEVEAIKLAHSIPDMYAYALTCDLGTTLLTGDYKFDQTPVDGVPADIARLAELGSEGHPAALRRLDERRPQRLVAVGVARRAEAGGDVRALRRPDRRDFVRLEHPPRPAGRRRRGRCSVARSRSSAARCARTSTSAASSATSRSPTGCSSSRARSRTSPTTS